MAQTVNTSPFILVKEIKNVIEQGATLFDFHIGNAVFNCDLSSRGEKLILTITHLNILQEVEIVKIDSNLKQGSYHYLFKTHLGNRARKLYYSFSDNLFLSVKCRKGKHRIYYKSQTSSKKFRANSNYHHNKERYKTLTAQENKRLVYNDKITRYGKKLARCYSLIEKYDNKRFEAFVVSFM